MFEAGRADVFAMGKLEDVLHSVNDGNRAVGVDLGTVSSANPPVFHNCLVCLFLVFQVA